MGYTSFLEDIMEEKEGHFDPMDIQKQSGLPNLVPLKEGEHVLIKLDKAGSDQVIGIVNRTDRFAAKVVFRVEGKTIIAELPLGLLEKVS